MNRNYTVALVWPLPFEGSGKDQMSNQEIKNRVMWELPKKMLDKGGQFLLGSKGDYLVILVEVGDGEAKQSQIDTLAKRKLQSILSYLSRAFSKNKIVIGLGRFYPGIRGLQQSYREAKRALRISENIPECQGIISFNDLGLYRFIYSQDREKEIQVYLREMVGKLIDYDREKNTDLIHTLQVYFKCRGNLKKVSEVLFIHYNTILYRLDRIQEISGLDLNSQDDRFNLDVALRLLAGRD
jgi:purine catabolism regulator